jgi:acetoin utilization deacetylase AcuC-like enzyme
MNTVLVTHPSSLLHLGPPDHPERPERVGAAVAGVRASGSGVVEVTARVASREDLLRVHSRGFVDRIEAFCAAGGGQLDVDTYAVRDSWDAARFAAGAGLTAVEAISSGEASAGFAAVRPPGHHADRDHAMGFCIFNNVAVTAASLVGRGERVAIVDWDVHHGNGTQDIFFRSPDVLYLSLHRSSFYPGTGRIEEVGRGLGTGANVNIPLPVGSGGETYRDAFARLVVPIVEQFDPDWVLVSAGYDAHRDDPLGGMRLTADDYRMMGGAVGAVADRTNTVFFLEGGYDLAAITESVAATLEGFAGTGEPSETVRHDPQITRLFSVFSLFWELDDGE